MKSLTVTHVFVAENVITAKYKYLNKEGTIARMLMYSRISCMVSSSTTGMIIPLFSASPLRRTRILTMSTMKEMLPISDQQILAYKYK